MTREFWVNLPVKDIKKSKDFFTQIGFSANPVPGNNENAASLLVGTKGVNIMLFEEKTFKSFSESKIADTAQSNEVLLSIDAENREEVNLLANKVRKAGGKVYNGPGEREGWMHGCGFSDLDGHRWTAVYMDMSKMPKA